MLCNTSAQGLVLHEIKWNFWNRQFHNCEFIKKKTSFYDPLSSKMQNHEVAK